MDTVDEVVDGLASGPTRAMRNDLAERAGAGRRLQHLRPTRVVCIGGGTGLPVVLRGLARLAGNTPRKLHITAVVAMSDDGGSSGKLRRELAILPPGDIRNCLVALSAQKSALGRLFQFRFTEEGALQGHTVGNLVLAALAQSRGDFLEAVRVSGELLHARGTVLPSTLRKVNVVAALEDGRKVEGERNLVRARGKVRTLSLSPAAPPPTPGLLSAIRNADLVVLGPGSLYTSLLPNLLVDGVAQALRTSPAVKVLVGNLMTEPGETDGMSGEDHVRAVLAHAGPVVDAVLVNRTPAAPSLLAKYAARGGYPLHFDRSALLKLGVVPIEKDVLKVSTIRVRHDSRKLASVLLELAEARRRAETHPV